ncbi:MAG: amidohydrolase [Candidatus Obscuribacterales bacterium]|nr:amidohydrolase [Candidatus Obscuribacterales bacterium]
MVLDIARFIAVDNHAHSLLRGHLEMDEIGFRRCFTESRSLAMIEEHVRHSTHYMDLLDHLERIFNTRTEQDFLTFRSKQNSTAFIRMLFDDVSIGAIIVDDGFRAADSFSLKEFAEVSGRPVFECRRIETVLEECLKRELSFDQLCQEFETQLTKPGQTQLVSLKTICGYRGGLDLTVPSREEAAQDYERHRKEWGVGTCRVERSPLYHYLLLQAFELAGRAGLPVQIHTGIGDDDADLLQCNPALMQRIFRSRTFAKTNFVLLHCFPYVREAAFMCALYPNVFMDLSLSVSLASSSSAAMISEALAGAPATKLLAGSDGHSCAEAHWYGMLCWKRGLTRSLFDMINNASVTHREAEQIAAFILHDNAIKLYKLEGLA